MAKNLHQGAIRRVKSPVGDIRFERLKVSSIQGSSAPVEARKCFAAQHLLLWVHVSVTPLVASHSFGMKFSLPKDREEAIAELEIVAQHALGTDREIATELLAAVRALPDKHPKVADIEVLAASWGESLPDEQVLARLRAINRRGRLWKTVYTRV